MAGAIAAAGPCTLAPRRTPGGAFGALARAICYQQLAAAAAGAIHGRFVTLCGGTPTAAAVAALPIEAMRATGLSGAKVRSMADLAARVSDGRLRLRGLDTLSDAEVELRLCQVTGIGPWTAQMFLMFHLLRPDVWPVGDLGVRVGFARIHGLATMTPVELMAAGDAYRPYRSVAAWYCWRAVDLPSKPSDPVSPWS